jgi:hypothetical protein
MMLYLSIGGVGWRDNLDVRYTTIEAGESRGSLSSGYEE